MKNAHTTQSDRQKEVTKTPEEISVREEAAARSSRPVERKVLMTQVRKARAEHAVKCILMPQ